MTTAQKTETSPIGGIVQAIISRYFQSLNAGEFEKTAALFAEDGVMQPPFESEIVGRLAIANYLHLEAKGIKAFPREGITQNLENNLLQVQVAGKAETSWCGVNVSWIFILNEKHQILFTKIKLLASPQELLALRKQ